MSGIDQRNAAINGDDVLLKQYIEARCNVCSSDEFGLTPLHYAVWNGHVECVKLLVCNTLGVDKDGNRASSLSITSCLGYTALHLAALDSPKKTVQEVTAVLLLAGLDTAALSSDNKTALEMAENVKNEGFLSTYKEYHGMYSDETVMQKYEALKEDLNTRYCFQVNTKTRGTVIPFEAKFPLPDFLFEAGRTGNIPDELTIHEHQIKPLVQSGYHDMRRLEALACLNFTKQESLSNLQRREHLVELSRDESFTRVEVSYKKLDSL